MTPILRRLTLLFAMLTFTAQLSLGQTATGQQVLGSFSGGPESINLGNLNVHWDFPVFSRLGRGINFSYLMSYDSAIWYPVTSNGVTSWQPTSNFGWRGQTEIATGYIDEISTSVTCWKTNPRVPAGSTTTYLWKYHDPYGGTHAFPGNSKAIVNYGVGGNCPQDSTTTLKSVASDNSGYTVNANGGNATISSKAGALINAPVGSPTGSASAVDSNGNQITVSSSGVFTDTLGTTALSIGGSQTSPPMFFYYTNTAGTQQQIEVDYTGLYVQTYFQCGAIGEYGPTLTNLPSQIKYPDGSTYTFSYEQTPNQPSNYVTGRIAGITVRTGGTYSYTYTGGAHGIECDSATSDGSNSGLTRKTNDGVNNYTTTYSRSNVSGTEYQTTVLSPDNNTTTINFQAVASPNALGNEYLETKRVVNQGPSTVLRTFFTCYNGATGDCSATGITLPISQVTVIPQLETGIESETKTLFNTYGLPSETDEYDFGSPSPGALLRKTSTSYASLGNGIFDRVASVQVQDGSGTQTAYTTYGYDETGVTATSGVPQHNAVSGSRGNLTSVNQWLNTTGTYLTTTMACDDTGNVLSTRDPGLHTTSIQYGNANAYPTLVTMPDTNSPNLAHHTTSATYDSNTGLPLTTIDQNGNQTSYHYDGMLRATEIDSPDGGVTTLNYANMTQVETRHKLTGSNWTDQWTEVDALGRFSRQEVWNGQGSNPWDQSVTCYDSVGRPSYQAYTFQDGGWSYGKNCTFAGDHRNPTKVRYENPYCWCYERRIGELDRVAHRLQL